jgi:putative flavoprotein involved in K+ transport
MEAMERLEAIVIGGGQAGLAVSRRLVEMGVDHVVLERERIGETWRRRWDSFCLVTPNWSVQLPGHPYDGNDPDGFMPRDEIVEYLGRYAAAAKLPVREGINVISLDSKSGGGFQVRTDLETLHAKNVVLATGAYQRAFRPAAATALPVELLQIDIGGFRNAGALPAGGVLIVGSGQSGCQIAEELCMAGRDVVLACGRAPWAPRRVGAHDLVWWLEESGFLDASVESLSAPAAKLAANVLATGHDGGHDLNLRMLQELGVTLTGRLMGASGHRARFAPDLAASVAWGDERYLQFTGLVQKVVTERGMTMPDLDPPASFDASMSEELDLAGFGAVIFAGGFRPDYESWLPWPQAFDDLGFPIQREGSSTVIPGLHFVGVHLLRKRKSALLLGVGEDATIVARTIAARH